MSTATTTATAPAIKVNNRIQLEALIRDFQQKLGPNWDKYHELLTMFLVGKLSRTELVKIIGPLLTDGLLKYHNQFLLLNFANSLQDSPLDFSSDLAQFWNKKNSKTKNVRSLQYEKFKQNIMGLPLKERRRIRNITKESGKKNKLSALITLTRHALLPKIPMIQDKEQQQLQVNNLVQWQQDVVNGINTPLATTTYELPDVETLSRRVLMTMRENGLTGGVRAEFLEVLSLGLEAHLKNIIDSAIDMAHYRESKYALNTFLMGSSLQGTSGGPPENGNKRKHEEIERKRDVVLNIGDLYKTFELFPHLTEPGGPRYRLSNVMLQNEDMIHHGEPLYPIPEKPTSLLQDDAGALLSRPEDNLNKNTNGNVVKSDTPDAKPRPEAPNVGSTSELKWMLHELISTM